MALSWNDLSDREKQALARQYEIDKCYSIDYSKYNAQPDSLRMMVRRYMRSMSNSPATYTPIDTAIDDTRRWQQTLQNLTNKNRFIQAMHLCDIQFPFQDDDALNLAYKLVAHVQPHIIVVGSDALDFHMLSNFGVDPDYSDNEDELDRAERYWNKHIHDLHEAAPNAAFLFIWGNHERRLLRDIANHAPALRKTIMRRFVEIIRCGGRVQYKGEIDRVLISDLLVQHGKKARKYESRNTLDDVGSQVHVMAGHIHRITPAFKPGILKNVRAVTSGCLCLLHPHYMRATVLDIPWQHGTAIADVDTKGMATNLDNNLEFVADTDGQLMARLGLTTIK